MTVRKMKEELEKRIEALGPSLPHNSLDQLIDGLGGPAFVAEVCNHDDDDVMMIQHSTLLIKYLCTCISCYHINIADVIIFANLQ